MDGQTILLEGGVDGQMDGWMDGWMDEWIPHVDRWMK